MLLYDSTVSGNCYKVRLLLRIWESPTSAESYPSPTGPIDPLSSAG